MAIKNLIFDLGGVIIDINYKNTINAFNRLGALKFESIYTQHTQSTLFDDFDTGKISEVEFRNQLRLILGLPLKDVEIDNAWNAMLLDLSGYKLEFINHLRKNYKVFLFSNTNSIHLKEVLNINYQQNNLSSFDSFFDKQYFSHLFGYRKPNPESFLKILTENNLTANETLFIDDSTQHIEGAKRVGILTWHFTTTQKFEDLLEEINGINR